MLLGENGQWTGPPVLVMRLRLVEEDQILDGRRRLAEHEARGLAYTPPRLTVTSHLQALTQLVLAGHHDRAAKHAALHAPRFRTYSAHALAQLTGLARQRWIPFREALKNPAERHKRPRRTLQVLSRALKLRERAQEGQGITLDDLEWVVEGFTDD